MKRLKKIEAKTMLSVFWYIDGQFFGPEDYLDGDSVLQYGDYLQVDADHYAEWGKLRSQLQLDNSIDYDYYPRGRVLFNSLLHKYVVVADPKIIEDDNIRQQLMDWYDLPTSKGAVIWKTDEHYTSVY